MKNAVSKFGYCLKFIKAHGKLNEGWMMKKNTIDRTKQWSSSRPISTVKLNVSLHLHLQPINLIVHKGSY